MVTLKRENIMASKRIEFHSSADFFASTGGLFGLFMGASLLSFIEFIYYFTLRLFYTRRAEHAKAKRATLAKPKSIFTISTAQYKN